MPASRNVFKRILVIGDWIVDDNWVVGDRKSDISTYIGQTYFRSLHHARGVVKRSGGAGRVAALLHAAQWGCDGQQDNCEIHGIGLWHPKDQTYLQSMFDPTNLLGGNPYRIVAIPPGHTPPNVYLHNLGDVLSAANIAIPYESTGLTHAHYYGTTRVYRVYKWSRSSLEHISRVDWELPAPYHIEQDPSWLPDRPERADLIGQVDDALKKMFQGMGEAAIDAVVIKDNVKGVVSAPLIESILRIAGAKLADKPWFILTKKWDPDWLKTLSNVNVQLLIFQEVALRQCAEVPTWITSGKHASSEALAELQKFDALLRGDVRRRMIVMLPDGLSAVASEKKAGSAPLILIQAKPNPTDGALELGVGNATALFATMVFGMLHDQDSKVQVAGSYLLDGALRVAQHWMNLEKKRLEEPEKPDSSAAEMVLGLGRPNGSDEKMTPRKITLSRMGDGTPVGGVEEATVEDLKEAGTVEEEKQDASVRWTESVTDLGLIRTDHGWQIELDKGCVELKDYVCCIPSKRRTIAALINSIKAFQPRNSRHAVSGILLAKPGSGKTQLVSSLENALALRVLSYNITAMTRREDLLLCFDQIVTTQLAYRREKILVFIDEINAHIEDQVVYDSFLTPLEDGYYIRSGTKFYIKPCIWLFVGTSSIDEITKEVKGSDFTSRMTWDTLDLGALPSEEEHYLHIENVYLGAAIARGLYSGLHKIHTEIVAFLGSLSKQVSAREIRGIIEREMRVDSHGGGRWRDLKRVMAKYHDKIDGTLHKRNNGILANYRSDKKPIAWVAISY